MEEVEVKTLEIDGKEYILIDTLDKDNEKYFCFSNSEDPSDIQIFKEEIDNDEKYFVSLDTDVEFNKVLMLFGQKYEDVINENTN